MTIAEPTLSQLLVTSKPSVSTAKALLVLDFQNDFLAEDGKLPVIINSGFETNVAVVADAVRQSSGHVVWIRTIFDPSRDSGEDVPCNDRPTANAMEQNDATAEDSDEEFFKGLIATSNKIGSRPSARRTVEILRKAVGAMEQKQGSGSSEELFLAKNIDPSLRCCISDSYGSQLSPKVAAAYREPDIDVVKSSYSAFHEPSLLQSLRIRMVTILYLCGSLTSSSVYATARDAVAHGFTVKIIKDCVGHRNSVEHQQTLRELQKILGAELINSETLTQELTSDASTKKAQDPIQNILDRLQNITNLSDVKHSRIRDKVPESHNSKETMEAESANGETTARADDQARLPHLETTQNRALTSAAKVVPPITTTNAEPLSIVSTTKSNMLEDETHSEKRAQAKKPPIKVEGDNIADDSKILYDAITDLASDQFSKLKNEIHWQKMFHANGPVPRLVCTQGTFGRDGSMPVYRHPSDQSLPLLHYSTMVKKIKSRVESAVGHPMNHVLIQLYRNGEDFISEHSDKTLDIVRGSSIVNVSLGAQRTMRLRTKRAFTKEKRSANGSTRTTQLIPMPHGSVFILGPKSNERWLHGINHDKRPLNEKTEAEKAFNGERISLTFRQIGTFLNSDCTRIWGQGAVAKYKHLSHPVINGNEEETQRMINAFGFENQQSDFDWDTTYGNGFDVLHFRDAPPDGCLLFLSGEAVRNTKVTMFLEELGRPYRIEGASSRDVGSKFDPEICLKDNDSQRTQIFGDIPILLYLSQTTTGQTSDGPSLAEVLYQLWALKDVVTLSDVFNGLQKLEEILTERNYIAGEFSIVDCAYWPIVRQIVKSSEPQQSQQFPNVAAYYRRLLDRPSVKKALQEELEYC